MEILQACQSLSAGMLMTMELEEMSFHSTGNHLNGTYNNTQEAMHAFVFLVFVST